MTKKKVESKHMPKSNELDSKGKGKPGRKPYCADSKTDAPQKKDPIDCCIEVTTKMLNGLRPERLAEVTTPQADKAERKHAALRIADSLCCALDPYALEAFADAVRRHMTHGRQVLELKNGLPDEKYAPDPQVKSMKQAVEERKPYHDSKGFSGHSESGKLKDAVESVEAAVRKLEPAALDFLLAGSDEGLKDAEKNIMRKTSARQIAEGLRGTFDPNAMVHLAEAIIDLMVEETGNICHVLDLSKQNRGFHGKEAETDASSYMEGAEKVAPAPGRPAVGLGTNMTREQLKAKLGDRFIATGELRPVKGQKLSAGEGVNTVNKSVDTVTALLQEALRMANHVDDIDLSNCHEQICSLEGVLSPVLLESQAIGLGGYANEGPCEINASDPGVIIEIKTLINLLNTHHVRMMGLMQRIEYLRNRVVL